MNSFIYLAPVAGVIALIFAFYKATRAKPEMTE